MKVFVMTDLEGVAGVVSFASQTYAGAPDMEKAKSLLTAEVNAAVRGLLDTGADEVVVMDGHGSGGILFEEIHEQAQLLHGRPIPPTWTEEIKGYDALIFIGQHAMAGVATGNMNHTQNSRAITYLKINDRLIGETGQFALLAGSYGVPSLFLSGDEAACSEAEDLLPGIVTVSVKRGIGRNAAVSLSAPEARKRICDGVKKALRKHGQEPVKPFRLPGPYVLEKRFFSTDLVEGYLNWPGVEFVDSLTVRIASENIREILYA